MEGLQKVNSDNSYLNSMSDRECVTKRISGCPSTWEAIYELRKPGQNFDQVIREMVVN